MIFCFSATGNSKYVAQSIAEATQDTMVSITDCIKEERFSFDMQARESIGFVTPVYHWGLPTIVLEFMEKLHLSFDSTPYVYHVLTFYTKTGKAHKLMEDALHTKGLELNGLFTVQMPDTWTPTVDLTDKNEIAEILKISEKQTIDVIDKVKNRVWGDFNDRKVPLAELYYRHYRKGGKTAKFSVDDSCIGCGKCAKICPVSAIRLQEKRPVWIKDRCAQCLGCLHRCPTFSIQLGKNTRGHGQYVNPNVRL